MSKNKQEANLIKLKPSETTQALRHMVNKKTAVFLWGPPGIGKSSLIKALAAELGYDFIDIRLSQMDPTDLRGIPYPTEELDADGKPQKGMKWSPPLVLPRDPNAKALILLDEFNSAAPTVQAASYQLVLDRALGEYVLPENCVIIAAGNRETDKGITFRMPTPIANRFVHIEMEANFDDWLQVALNANYDKDVVGYLTAFKHELFSFDAGSASRGFQTPRSWEFVSRIMDGANALPGQVLTGLITGAIGDGQAMKFLEHRKNAEHMPNPSDVLAGTVKQLKRNDVSLCYALTTALCYELRDRWTEATREGKPKDEVRTAWLKQANNFIDFMMKNFGPEVTVMGAKTALSVFKLPFDPKKMPAFEEFTKKFKDMIMS